MRRHCVAGIGRKQLGTLASEQAVCASGCGEYHDKTQSKENFVKSLDSCERAAVPIFDS